MFRKGLFIILVCSSFLNATTPELSQDFENKVIADVVELKRVFVTSVQAGKETQQKLQECTDVQRDVFINCFLKLDEEFVKSNEVNSDLLEQVKMIDASLAQNLYMYITKSKEMRDKFEALFAMIDELPLEHRSLGILYVLELLEHIGFRLNYKADTGQFEIDGI